MNPLEREISEIYRKQRWQVLRAGWPDFLLVRNGYLVGIEVKSPPDKISAVQARMFNALSLLIPIVEVRKGIGWGSNVNLGDGGTCYELIYSDPNSPTDPFLTAQQCKMLGAAKWGKP